MNDPLFGNKVAAAILATVLIAVGLPITFTTLEKISAGHHKHEFEASNPFGLAYIPTDIKLEGATAAAPPAPELSLGEIMVNAAMDRGERAAGACAACHSFEMGGPNGIGPNLWDVVGREVGSVPGFGYSAALTSMAGTSWTYEMIDAYIRNSQEFAPGSTMNQMVRRPQRRGDILAYLGSLSDDPVPFPEIAPPAAAEEAALDLEAVPGEEAAEEVVQQ